MKLLLDENLSPRLVRVLRPWYPGTEHVEQAGLEGQPDEAIWNYAKHAGMAIVSKDNDFRQMAFLFGPPPKVVWLAVRDAGTDAIGRLLLERVGAVREFFAAPEEGLLILELSPIEKP